MSKEKILEEFEKSVFGDCFAGGTFIDNEKQAMYTSGFKEGFNRAKNMSKQFLSQAIDQTREETIRDVENGLPPTRTALYATGEFPATAETKLSIRYQEGLNEGEKRYKDKIKQLLINLRK